MNRESEQPSPVRCLIALIAGAIGFFAAAVSGEPFSYCVAFAVIALTGGMVLPEVAGIAVCLGFIYLIYRVVDFIGSFL